MYLTHKFSPHPVYDIFYCVSTNYYVCRNAHVLQICSSESKFPWRGDQGTLFTCSSCTWRKQKDVFREGHHGKVLSFGELLLAAGIAGMPAAYMWVYTQSHNFRRANQGHMKDNSSRRRKDSFAVTGSSWSNCIQRYYWWSFKDLPRRGSPRWVSWGLPILPIFQCYWRVSQLYSRAA